MADMMMAAAVGHLVEGGFERAVLWVLRDNPRARRFYERAGWTLTGATGGTLESFSLPQGRVILNMPGAAASLTPEAGHLMPGLTYA